MNKILFFILLPIILPLSLFSFTTHNWWVGLSSKRGLGLILFYVLMPIYAPLAVLMNWAFSWWSKLLD